jgi:hypothetical protein
LEPGFGGIRRNACTESRRLITRRSRVQIPPPLLEKALTTGPFCYLLPILISYCKRRVRWAVVSCCCRGLGAHSAAHVPRIRNETEGSFRVTEVVPNLGLHPCSGVTIEGLNEASYSADACSEWEPEIV